MTDTVLVLGGGGFVGGAILRAVQAAPGLSPLAGLRRAPAHMPGIAHRLCDATDARAVAEAARGARYAVNAVLGSAATMLAATRNLCRSGVRRIVHISSISVYGDAEGVLDEDATLAAGTPYAAAKLACEAEIAGFVAAGGEAVILRPGIVYGPGGEQWVGRPARLLRAGRLGDLGVDGDGFCNLIYHDDLGAAAVAALTARLPAGVAINLAPTAPPTWNEFFVRLGCAIAAVPVRRLTARRLRAETAVLAPLLQLGKLAGMRAGLRPGTLPEPIPPSLLRLFRQRLMLDCGRADRLLGLTRTPFATALAACAAWQAVPAR